MASISCRHGRGSVRFGFQGRMYPVGAENQQKAKRIKDQVVISKWIDENALRMLVVRDLNATSVSAISASAFMSLFSTFVLPLIMWGFFKAMDAVGTSGYAEDKKAGVKTWSAAVTHRKKMVSHRLRGFGKPEASGGALRRFLQSGGMICEVDTRISADGEILVIHDARLDRLTTETGLVRNYRIDENGCPVFRNSTESVLRLDEFLAIFAEGSDQRLLLLDIKDTGKEWKHWDLIQKHGLQESVGIVSWLPQVLLTLHDLDAALPLYFSNVNMSARLRRGAGMIRFFDRMQLGKLFGLGGGLNESLFWLRDVRLFVGGTDPFELQPPEATSVGFNDTYLLEGLPSGKLLEAIRLSKGGIGTVVPFATPNLAQAAREQDLQIYVFSLDELSAVNKMMCDLQPDMVFTNQAKLFYRHENSN